MNKYTLPIQLILLNVCVISLVNISSVKTTRRCTKSFSLHPPSSLSFIIPSPAHGVVVLRVTEAGRFQLAAHHRTGALVSCQVALQTTLAIHTRPWDTTDEAPKEDSYDSTWNLMFAQVSVYFCFQRSQTFLTSPHSLIISQHIYRLDIGTVPNLDGTLSSGTIFHQCCALLFLTVLVHVVSVPRSLSPEGNYRLCFSLVVQRLHTACSIRAVKKRHRNGIRTQQDFNMEQVCISNVCGGSIYGIHIIINTFYGLGVLHQLPLIHVSE